MKLKHILAAILIAAFMPHMASAQYNNPYWQWAKADATGAMSSPVGSSVLAVKNGRTLWGRMTAIGRYDAAGNAQGRYSFREYDSNGTAFNATIIAGKVQLLDAQADGGGNWYILGRFYDSAIFANGTTLIRPNPAVSIDANHFMVRLNAGSLNVAWAKLIGPLTNVSARTFTLDGSRIYLAADSDDYTAIHAMSFGTGDFTTMFTQNTAGTTTSIQVDGSGNIYLAGGCAFTGANFNGPVEAVTVPDAYGYIVKYSSAGVHQWHHWFKDLDCSPRKLTLYKNNVLYYTGNLRDTMVLGGTTTIRPGRGGYYAARLNPATGGVVWARTLDTTGGGGAIPGDAYHAAVTPDTALVMFLEGSGYINWGDTFTTDLQAVANSAVLASISATDSFRWVRSAYAQTATNAHVVAEGNAVWVCGVAFGASGQVAFDTLRLTVPALTYTPYMAKLKLIRPPFMPTPNGVSGVAEASVFAGPVPAKAALRISGMNDGGVAILRDGLGREVARISIGRSSGEALMDVAALPRGVYLLELRGAASTPIVRKIVLQ